MLKLDSLLMIYLDKDASEFQFIKKRLLLGRKAMANLDCMLKSRDITFLTKVRIAKAMVFPVVMDGCELDHKEGWAPKN